MDLATNLKEIREEVSAACATARRDPATIRIIAVTKNQGVEVLPRLIAAGLCDLGENRIDHLQMMHASAPPDLRFHAIGRVQGRQLAKLAPLCCALHSLCDYDHIPRLGRACTALGQPIEVFLQVNTSGEAAKAGLTPEELPRAVDAVRAQAHLSLVGLMTMAPELEEGADPALVRRTFARCRELADRHGLARLSMGMSQDFPLAILEGATEIRIGSRLFKAVGPA